MKKSNLVKKLLLPIFCISLTFETALAGKSKSQTILRNKERDLKAWTMEKMEFPERPTKLKLASRELEFKLKEEKRLVQRERLELKTKRQAERKRREELKQAHTKILELSNEMMANGTALRDLHKLSNNFDNAHETVNGRKAYTPFYGKKMGQL